MLCHTDGDDMHSGAGAESTGVAALAVTLSSHCTPWHSLQPGAHTPAAAVGLLPALWPGSCCRLWCTAGVWLQVSPFCVPSPRSPPSPLPTLAASPQSVLHCPVGPPGVPNPYVHHFLPLTSYKGQSDPLQSCAWRF